jgi:1-acyl-sn-glycerol-3-phosphate acyltransferase
MRLRGPLLGLVMFALLLANTLFWAVPVYASIALKLILPRRAWRERAGTWVAHYAQRWALTNVALGDRLIGIEWDVRLPERLDPRGKYLVIANHQSWNDIYALVRAFGRRTPFFKFFLKKELIWVPILGPVWWGLDYPFMHRHSRAQRTANPALARADLETTRRAVAKYQRLPVTLLTFLEGTRFTRAKHDAQKSPYRHLLKPKAGGMAYTLAAMGHSLSALLDVTIVYPEGARSLWDFLAGRVRRVVVEVRSLRIPPEFVAAGGYDSDPQTRRRVQEWVNQLWTSKDARIAELLAEADPRLSAAA